MSDHNEETVWVNLEADGVGIMVIPKATTIIHIGKDIGCHISVDKRFNRFQKKMINWCFGWEVEDVKDET